MGILIRILGIIAVLTLLCVGGILLSFGTSEDSFEKRFEWTFGKSFESTWSQAFEKSWNETFGDEFDVALRKRFREWFGKSYEVDVNGGGEHVDLETFNGSIRVEQID